MANFNPSSPAVVGLEFNPYARSAVTIVGSSAGAATVASTVAETVATLRAALTSITGTAGLMADIYTGTPPGALGSRTTTTAYPTADAGRVGWTTFTGGTTNLWATLDHAPSTSGDTDGIRDPAAAVAVDAVQFRLGALSAFAASRRVLTVKANVRVIGGAMNINFYRGGDPYGTRSTGYNGSAFRTVTVEWGELCPWTGLPWTQADLVELSDGTATIRVVRADQSSGYLIPQMSALQVEVVHVAETRAAFGVALTPTGVTDFALLTPGNPAGSGWAKAAATTYTVVLRRRRAGGAPQSAGWLYQRSARTFPSIPVGVNVGTDADGVPVATGSSPDPQVNRTAPAFVMLVGGAVSVDSQPYGSRSDDRPMGTAGANSQSFTAPATGSYGVIRAAVRVPPGGSLTRLRMEVRRVSDNVMMGTAVEVTREAALAGTALGGGLYLAQAQMGTPAALVSGTAYRVVFSLVNGVDPWHVALLLGLGATAGGGFGGTTGAATVNGSTSFGSAPTAGSDWMVQVATLPTALASAAAVLESLPLAPPRAPGIG